MHEIDPGKWINYGVAIVYPAKIPLSRPFAMGRVDKKKKIPIIVFKTPRLGQCSGSAGYWTWVKSGFAKLKSMLFALR